MSMFWRVNIINDAIQYVGIACNSTAYFSLSLTVYVAFRSNPPLSFFTVAATRY